MVSECHFSRSLSYSDILILKRPGYTTEYVNFGNIFSNASPGMQASPVKYNTGEQENLQTNVIFYGYQVILVFKATKVLETRKCVNFGNISNLNFSDLSRTPTQRNKITSHMHTSVDVWVSIIICEGHQVILGLNQQKSWKQGNIFTSEISITTFQ